MLIAPMIEGLKELHRGVASLKIENITKDQKIKKLEQENAVIKARLDKLEKVLNLKK